MRMKKLLTFLTLLTLFFTAGWAEEVTDHITRSTTGVASGSQTYSDWSGKTCVDGSTAVYAGNSAGQNDAIQLRSNNSNSGIVSTTSGGKIKKVRVNWYSGTANGRTLNIYGSNTAYTSPTELYNNVNGTKLGTIVKGTSTELEITGDYTYIGLRSNSSAMYIVDIWITWETGGGSTTETCATPTFSPVAGTYYEPQSVTLSCATPGSTIYYTTDGSNPTTSSTEYTSAISVSETTTIKAIATADGMDPSSVASATYTIFEPETVTPTYEQSLISGFGKFYYVDKTNPTTSAIWKSNNYGAVASGQISGTKYDTESWLYTPYIDLTNATNPELSFSHAGNFFQTYMQTDAQVKVRVLNGTEWSEWSDLAISTWPNGTSWDFVDNTTSLLTYAGKKIQIAFKYTSSTSRAGSWEIKNFKIENVATKYSVTCNTAENGSISTDESEYAEGTTVNVSVTPADGYELATLVYNDGEDHDIKDAKSFTMPASNVTVTATFSKVGDLYIIGNVNGIDVNNWHANQGVKMNFVDGVYTADIWVTGKWNDQMQKNAGTFAFFTVLANANDQGSWSYVNGNRYEPDVRNISNPDEQVGSSSWWLANDENSVNTNVTLLKRNWDDDFLIPAGLYTVTVSADLTKFNLTAIKDITPTITPNGGDVALNSTATVALSEDFNEFIANCPKVLECTPGNGSDVYTELSLTLPEVKLVLNGNVAEGTTTDYEFATAGSVTLTSEGKLMLSGSEITSATKTATATFNVTEVDMSNVYTLVESANDLVAGGEYLIVGSTNDAPYSAILGAMAGSGATYANAIKENFTYDATAKTITLNEGCTATPLILGGESGAWTFNNGSGYIAYTKEKGTTKNNNLWLNSSATDNGSTWTIATDKLPSNNALIINVYNDERKLQYNDDRFAAYTGNQSAVALFKKATATTPKSDAPVITPESKDVKGGLLEDVTITAAQGATIYYTTDGSDPSDDTNTNRVQYTEPFNIQVAQGGPQTVKAIAIETGKDASNVVSVQYMFKNPDAPTFTPDPAVVQTGDFTITINSADGGVIYYVLDPDANEFPSNSEEAIATGQVYADGVAVSGTGEHKIYAAVVLNGLKSTLSTATYTVIETGAEGDWKLVESLDDIQAGRDYIIVNSDRDRAIKSGDLETSRFYSTPCEGHVVFGPNFASATVAGTDVRVFSFEAENGKMYMKDSGTSQYYNLSSDVSTGKTPVVISMSDGFVYINGEGGTKKLAYNTAYGNYFGMYTNPTTTGSQRPIYMYYRGATVTPSVTLAELCQNGVTTDGSNKYVIKDRLVAVYADLTKGVLWCKDEGNASIFPTNIKEGQIDYLYNDTKAQNKRDWDQSNWIALHFTTPTSTNGIDEMLRNAQNHYIKAGTIKGTYFDKVNYALRMDNEALDLVTPADEGGNVQPDYIPNVYCTTNFLPDNLNIWGDERDGGYTTGSDQNYFFMNPKIQEICEITYAQWDAFNLCFTVPSNSGFDGAFYVGWGYNVLGDLRNSLQDEHIYKFQAIVQRSDKDSYGPKNITTPYAGFTVYPVDLDVTEDSGHDITTAINTVSVNGDVKSVKYVNVAGVVSDKPFSGVNIVVTEYTDGSRTTSKMLRK